jgi:hypothetical protein
MNEMPTLMKLVLINIERINEIDRTSENQKLDQTNKTSIPSKGNCIREKVDDMDEIDKTCDSNDKDEIWQYG